MMPRVQHVVAGDACCLTMFFPHLADLAAGEVTDQGDYVLVAAHTGDGAAACRGCAASSSRVHGRYRRLLRDLPAAGRPVLIALTVRRLACQNPACRVRTFAEPVPGLTQRYARRTMLLRGLLELMALALAGQAVPGCWRCWALTDDAETRRRPRCYGAQRARVGVAARVSVTHR
jgi:hypothetical protein